MSDDDVVFRVTFGVRYGKPFVESAEGHNGRLDAHKGASWSDVLALAEQVHPDYAEQVRAKLRALAEQAVQRREQARERAEREAASAITAAQDAVDAVALARDLAPAEPEAERGAE